MGLIGFIVLERAFDPGAITRPGLGARITGLYEESVAGPLPCAEHGDRIRVVEARQVPEIAVLAEGEFRIRRAHGEASAHDNRDGVGTHGIEQLLTPFGEHGQQSIPSQDPRCADREGRRGTRARTREPLASRQSANSGGSKRMWQNGSTIWKHYRILNCEMSGADPLIEMQTQNASRWITAYAAARDDSSVFSDICRF
jgi:hypothetical protein